ncbi:MAG: VOC family protein [Pseudomonadota bacterium]
MSLSILARILTVVLAILCVASCALKKTEDIGERQPVAQNPVSYFELPVTEMERAIRFYEAVFQTTLERTVIDGYEMALFPFDDKGEGISGALAKGDSYVPSLTGPRIYFFVENIDETLARATSSGGKIAYSKTDVGDFWVAEFKDTEGNQIALSASKNPASKNPVSKSTSSNE